MPGMNVYIATSPNLAAHIQRASSTLSFENVVIPVSSRMAGLSKETVDILYDKDAEKEGRINFMAHMHNYLYALLAPAEIKGIGAVVLDQLSQHINAMPAHIDVRLFWWCCQLFTQSTTYAFYGPDHIFAKDPSLVKDFWDWEEGLMGFMASPVPQLTARKSYLACERMVVAFKEYISEERQKNASAVIKERIRWHQERGISLDDMGRCEVIMLFGALTNGGVTLFWMLNYIFSNPELLSNLREEITSHAYSTDATSQTASIAFKGLQECALLNSVLKEVLRLTAPMASTRLVMKDTIIADTYLLRANSIAMLAGGFMHEDINIWGPDASSFNPRRFAKSIHGTKTGVTDSEKSAVHPAAWRGFGGGAVFCPGRHFAQIEILSVVATLVMGWEMVPQEGQTKVDWHPPKDEKRIPIGVMKPLRDVNVSLRRREGMENLVWTLKLA